MRALRPLLILGLVLGPVLAVACGDPFALPRASLVNIVDTVSLYALSGTPPRTPSGYFLGNYLVPPVPVLIQNGDGFDFAVDLDSAYRPKLLPTGALRLGRASGVQLTTLPFDSIKVAPAGGFQLDSAVTVDVGGRAIVHSRNVSCSFGIPAVYYAKIQILAVDTATRRIDFQILVNDNCGYRGLEPGVPSR
jgi:hypothetical protein